MAKHHGRSFRADPGGDWNGTVYDDFVCDTFDVDVSEEYEKIFDLLCAGTDLWKDFPDPCIVYFYDRSGSLLLGILVILAAGHFGIWSGLAVQLGVVQMIGCLLVVVLLLASSALMCLSMVKGSSAREQYGKGI